MRLIISMLIILGAYIIGFIVGYEFTKTNKSKIKGNNKVIQIKNEK